MLPEYAPLDEIWTSLKCHHLLDVNKYSCFFLSPDHFDHHQFTCRLIESSTFLPWLTFFSSLNWFALETELQCECKYDWCCGFWRTADQQKTLRSTNLGSAILKLKRLTLPNFAASTQLLKTFKELSTFWCYHKKNRGWSSWWHVWHVSQRCWAMMVEHLKQNDITTVI